MKRSILLFLTVFLISSCATPTPVTPEHSYLLETYTEETGIMQLTSNAFTNGQSIPVKYSCIGKNISPALAWTEPPAGTQSFALIVDDPDAPGGTWVHWVLYNIPADTRTLQEDLSATENNTITVGKNSSHHPGYDGPCPPGGTHRYFFKLYALDTVVNLQPGTTKDQLLKEMESHILTQTELMGTFSK